MDPLVEGVHDPSLGEFPCVRASVAAGDVLGRAEEEEPLLEDVAQGSGWGWLQETPGCPNGGGSCLPGGWRRPSRKREPRDGFCSLRHERGDSDRVHLARLAPFGPGLSFLPW